ncbi:MAG: hypothetical protein O2820_12160 [Planctomycetota bacterium]|nr:hypothetical protein [Planctomycetota bacterium]MDA1249965.1 hypothetical protein [Planctomycetota bacterium]
MLELPEQIVQLDSLDGLRLRIDRHHAQVHGSCFFGVVATAFLIAGTLAGGIALWDFEQNFRENWMFTVVLILFVGLPLIALGIATFVLVVYEKTGHEDLSLDSFGITIRRRIGFVTVWKKQIPVLRIARISSISKSRGKESRGITIQTKAGRSIGLCTEQKAAVIKPLAKIMHSYVRQPFSAAEDEGLPYNEFDPEQSLSAARPRHRDVTLDLVDERPSHLVRIIGTALIVGTFSLCMFLAAYSPHPVVLIGLPSLALVFFVGLYLRTLLASMMIDEPHVTVSASPVRLGETVTGAFSQTAKRDVHVMGLQLRLICRETIHGETSESDGRTVGTKSHNEILVFPLAEVEPHVLAGGESIELTFTVDLPVDAEHTHSRSISKTENRSREITWFVESNTCIAWGTDILRKYELPVRRAT